MRSTDSCRMAYRLRRVNISVRLAYTVVRAVDILRPQLLSDFVTLVCSLRLTFIALDKRSDWMIFALNKFSISCRDREMLRICFHVIELASTFELPEQRQAMVHEKGNVQ